MNPTRCRATHSCRQLALTPLVLMASAALASLPVVESPDGRLRVVVEVADGVVQFGLVHDGDPLLAPSPLGLTFREHGPLGGLEVTGHDLNEHDEVWRPVWGRAAEVRDHHRELSVHLRERQPPQRRVTIVVRAYDDGMALRYVLPAQEALRDVALLSEDTEFRFRGDPHAWWIPADEFAYESLHRETPLSEAGHLNTPVTMRTAGGRWLSLHEAALIDYPEMTLRPLGGANLRVHLWPWPDGDAVKGATPLVSPWRTIQVSDRLGGLAESHLIQNLNAPCAIDDTSFIEPMTFIGIWWGLHTGRWTWSAGPRHGATTERALEYLAFAARHGVGGVLVEGWNQGWETWGAGESRQDYLTPYPDFDLAAVARAADSLGVRLIGHHETGGNVPMYEAQLEDALTLYGRIGIRSVKTGYAGPIRPEGMHHHGQYMVRHFQRVVQAAARHRVTLNVHEGIKPTGLERTWPNLMCTEAVRGNEWNATLNTVPPRHATLLPFTRLLAGPADATPGFLELDHAPERGRRILATVANQLALPIVLHSPLMMLADLPEHYMGRPAFQFLRQVPVTWDETRVVDADMGRYVVIARRRGEQWHLGAITDHDPRRLAIPLSFLAAGRAYLADVHADAPEADWQHRPDALVISRARVTAADTLHAVLSRAGGVAVRLTPATVSDLAGVAPLIRDDALAAEQLRRYLRLDVPGERRVDHGGVGAEVTLQWPPDPRHDQGDLTDGHLAGAGFRDPAWLGFEADDLVATIALDRPRALASLTLRVLHEPASWIMTPRLVEVQVNDDGRGFVTVAHLEPAAPDEHAIVDLDLDLAGVTARVVRIVARQRPLPTGHPGHGSPGWLFCDEVILHPEG